LGLVLDPRSKECVESPNPDPVDGEPEPEPEPECLVINETNYIDCKKVKCPEGSIEPYADSLNECYAAVFECEDPNRIKNEDTSCSNECQGNMVLTDQGNGNFLCQPPEETIQYCADEKTIRDPETGCPEDYCPDGSLKGADGKCPEVGNPECKDCSCKEYALKNPLECGPDPECKDCSCAEYALKNPLECGPVENPCDNPSYAEDNPLECGWVECPSGGFAPTIELCGGSGGGGGCPEGQEPCEALGGECANPEDCPGGGEESAGGGGGSSGSLFKEFTPTLSGDPELLARQEFPITDFLMGLFTGK
jgi:hypothetical protein